MKRSVLKQESPVASADERLSTDDASSPTIEESDADDAPDADDGGEPAVDGDERAVDESNDEVSNADGSDAAGPEADDAPEADDGSDDEPTPVTRKDLLEAGLLMPDVDTDDLDDCCVSWDFRGP